MSKKYLVTGGAGCLGAPLVKALIAQGNRVAVLDDGSRGDALRLKGLDVEMWMGDIRHARWVAEATRNTNPDCVIHLAAVNGTKNFYEQPHRVLEVGVKGIVNVMDACIACGVKEILAASSSEVYAEPIERPTPEDTLLKIPNPCNSRYTYSSSKILTEMMVLHYGKNHFTRRLIVRPHNIYGPDCGEDHVIPQLIRRLLKLSINSRSSLRLQGSEIDSRAFCYINDAVAGILTVLDRHEGSWGIYNVGTDHEVLITNVAGRLARLVGREVVLSEGTSPNPGGPTRRCPDISKLESLGWEPRVTLWEGLRKTVDWYVENPVEKAP